MPDTEELANQSAFRYWWRIRKKQRPFIVHAFWLGNAGRWASLREILLTERGLTEEEANHAP